MKKIGENGMIERLSLTEKIGDNVEYNILDKWIFEWKKNCFSAFTEPIYITFFAKKPRRKQKP